MLEQKKKSMAFLLLGLFFLLSSLSSVICAQCWVVLLDFISVTSRCFTFHPKGVFSFFYQAVRKSHHSSHPSSSSFLLLLLYLLCLMTCTSKPLATKAFQRVGSGWNYFPLWNAIAATLHAFWMNYPLNGHSHLTLDVMNQRMVENKGL